MTKGKLKRYRKRERKEEEEKRKKRRKERIEENKGVKKRGRVEDTPHGERNIDQRTGREKCDGRLTVLRTDWSLAKSPVSLSWAATLQLV